MFQIVRVQQNLMSLSVHFVFDLALTVETLEAAAACMI